MNSNDSLLSQLSESSRQFCLGAPLTSIAISFPDSETKFPLPVGTTEKAIEEAKEILRKEQYHCSVTQ